MDVREDIQRQAKEAFFATNMKSCILMGTGIGKSKVAIDIIEELRTRESSAELIFNESVLLLVSSERLRDNDWKANFEKFGTDWKFIVPECYQTAYKWTGRHFGVVIADEFDFALTEQYSSFFVSNTYDVLIALTAYIPEHKRELANSIAPVCFEESTQSAQDKGLLNKTKFIQVNFDLSNDKDIQVKKKDGNFFYQSENGYYTFYEEAIQKAIIAKSVLEGKANANDLMNVSNAEVDKKLAKVQYQLEYLIRKRKDLLHTLTSAQKVTKNLLHEILKDENNKVIVFSKRTEQISKICDNTYHSKNKGDGIDLFDSGKARLLGVCEAINRGSNLERASHIIKESYVGSDTDFQQQHGRGVRLKPDEIMTFIILVPHFWIRVAILDEKKNLLRYEWARRPTQAKQWMSKMLEGFNYEPIIVEADKSYKTAI